MRREVLLWSVAAAAVLLAFGVTLLTLNLTVYSASGFVQTYLDALARKDAPAALEMVGAGATGDASQALLVREAMGDLEDIRVVADRADAGEVHHVTVSYTAGGEAGTSEFTVRRTGSLLGLFNDWSFAKSPLSVLALTLQHDDDFVANGLSLVADAGQDAQSLYLAFTPSSIRLEHDSRYLTGGPVTAMVRQPGSSVPAVLEIRPTDVFVEQVQGEVERFLDDCTTQVVLLPTGCPFGRTIDDRVVSDPQWSMTEYPRVTLVPSGEVATWLVPATGGIAHLVVEVQSLFDGTVSTMDEDVPFAVAYTVTILPGELLIRSAPE